jgi:K+-transporting ATPase ATPase A chain
LSNPSAGIEFLVLLVVALAVVHVLPGDYMYRVYSSTRDWRVERVIYHVVSVDPKAQLPHVYARNVLARSAVSVLPLFFSQLLQGKLRLHLPIQQHRGPSRWPETRRSAL